MYVFEREEIFICLVLQCMVLRDIAKYCIHVLVRAHMHGNGSVLSNESHCVTDPGWPLWQEWYTYMGWIQQILYISIFWKYTRFFF